MLLHVDNISKLFGETRALDSVSMAGDAGEIVGLIGPNGAGKTTLISILLGLVEQTAGTVTITGDILRTGNRKILKKMNYAASYAELPSNLTVYENLLVYGLIYEVPELKKIIKSSLESFGLDKLADKKTGFLSTGERMKLILAKALLNRPKILLLDEPTSSLDPYISKLLREKIRTYATNEEALVLWTSHDMHEVEQIADRVIFLREGKIILEGKPNELPRKYGLADLEELFIHFFGEDKNLKKHI